MGRLFPVEEEDSEELIKSLVTSTEYTEENGLKEFFTIMSSNFLEKKNNLRYLLLENYGFNFITYAIGLRKINIEESEILKDLDDNKSYEEIQIIFYNKLEKMFEDSHADNSELICMIEDFNYFFNSFKFEHKKFQKSEISSYLYHAISDAVDESKVEEIFNRLYPNIENGSIIEMIQDSGLKILIDLLIIGNPNYPFSELESSILPYLTHFDEHLEKALVEKKGENPGLDFIVCKMEFCFRKVISKVKESVIDNSEYAEWIRLIDKLIDTMKIWE